jgi:hypothetical protein
MSEYQGSCKKLLLIGDDKKSKPDGDFAECIYISCFWFYLSAYFGFELPLKPFEMAFGETREAGEKRIKSLLNESLKIMGFEAEIKLYEECFARY